MNYLRLKFRTKSNIERRDLYSGLEGNQTLIYAVTQIPLISLECYRDFQTRKWAYNAISIYVHYIEHVIFLN